MDNLARHLPAPALTAAVNPDVSRLVDLILDAAYDKAIAEELATLTDEQHNAK
ncbi:hypothetical protein [Neolewinella maritima]|uniref:hypothetical protein n=1 Tax=Neolewinella maritima TaxID=1383882 RepID=UPI001EE7B6ED|nr:hypothetical protein [Neolewinella maritima]